MNTLNWFNGRGVNVKCAVTVVQLVEELFLVTGFRDFGQLEADAVTVATSGVTF